MHDFLLSIADFWRAPKWATELATAQNVLLTRTRHILANQETIMAKVDDVLAEITENTDMVRATAAGVDAMKEGQATLAAEIQALKDQISQGNQQPDFASIDAALAGQKQLIENLKTAIGAGTGETLPGA